MSGELQVSLKVFPLFRAILEVLGSPCNLATSEGCSWPLLLSLVTQGQKRRAVFELWMQLATIWGFSLLGNLLEKLQEVAGKRG